MKCKMVDLILRKIYTGGEAVLKGCGGDWTGSSQEPVAAFREHGNERSDFIKGTKCFDPLGEY
jgi:hypothetical protein